MLKRRYASLCFFTPRCLRMPRRFQLREALAILPDIIILPPPEDRILRHRQSPRHCRRYCFRCFCQIIYFFSVTPLPPVTLSMLMPAHTFRIRTSSPRPPSHARRFFAFLRQSTMRIMRAMPRPVRPPRHATTAAAACLRERYMDAAQAMLIRRRAHAHAIAVTPCLPEASSAA